MSETPNNLSAPLEPERPATWQIWLAAGPVLLLAFLLASFPARNSEVWRHLATGRALLDGSYTPGTDPFSYTTEGITWVNHSWLTDLALYAIHASGGRLVMAKALVALLLAAFVLAASSLTKGPWIASLAAAFAMACVGPHLILAPQFVSYLIFGFTIWWLRRPSMADGSLRDNLPLFLAFILWSNCDEWFLLGPTTVGLFWLGSMMQSPHPERKDLRYVFLVSLAVGVLNPHHVRIYRLPAVLIDHATSGLGNLASAPWSSYPGPQIAFAALMALVVVAFVVTRSARDWPMTLISAALLGLALYRSAAIPFFAIAAAPLLAQLGGSLALPVDGAAQERRRFAWLGPVAVIAVLVALVVAACPGWLQGTYEPRGWHVHVDPSLKRVAEQLADWHGIGRLGADARGYSPSVDLAHYIEWFCPEEKVFRDSRTNLYPASVESDHQKVARALTAESGLRFDETWADAHDALNRYGVTHLVVADAADRRLVAALRNLLNMPREWRLVGLYGRTAVFARTPARQPGPDLPLMSLDRRVFGGAAPRQGPGRDLQPRPWWDCFVWSDPDGGLDRDEAIVEVMHFDAMGPAYRERNRRTWEVEVLIAQLGTIAPQGSLVEALAGCYPHSLLATSQRPIPAGVPTALDSLTYQMIAAHAQNSDQGPPGSLLFAVRAARRALLANPEDALAHLALGRAYERFQRFSAERGAGASFPLLKQVREVQALVALNRAVQLKPDLLAAHELLASLYLEARGFDLALPHVQAQLRLTQSAGPRPGEKPQDFTARIDKLTAQEHTLGKQVRELLNLVDSQSLKLDAYGKARLAEANGLPGYALQHLLRSNYAEFGVEGALNQLHLLLRTGRTKDIRMMIDPAQEAKMGMFNYRWLRTLLAVADGDYDQADAHLQQLVVGGVDLPDLGARNLRPHTALAMLVGQQMLNGGSIHPQQPIVQVFTLGPWQDVDTQAIYVRKLEGLAGIARMDADVHALRGLLHLESGAIEPARRAFRDALTDWNSDGGSAFLAKHYLNLIP